MAQSAARVPESGWGSTILNAPCSLFAELCHAIASYVTNHFETLLPSYQRQLEEYKKNEDAIKAYNTSDLEVELSRAFQETDFSNADSVAKLETTMRELIQTEADETIIKMCQVANSPLGRWKPNGGDSLAPLVQEKLLAFEDAVARTLQGDVLLRAVKVKNPQAQEGLTPETAMEQAINLLKFCSKYPCLEESTKGLIQHISSSRVKTLEENERAASKAIDAFQIGTGKEGVDGIVNALKSYSETLKSLSAPLEALRGADHPSAKAAIAKVEASVVSLKGKLQELVQRMKERDEVLSLDIAQFELQIAQLTRQVEKTDKKIGQVEGRIAEKKQEITRKEESLAEKKAEVTKDLGLKEKRAIAEVGIWGVLRQYGIKGNRATVTLSDFPGPQPKQEELRAQLAATGRALLHSPSVQEAGGRLFSMFAVSARAVITEHAPSVATTTLLSVLPQYLPESEWKMLKANIEERDELIKQERIGLGEEVDQLELKLGESKQAHAAEIELKDQLVAKKKEQQSAIDAANESQAARTMEQVQLKNEIETLGRVAF